LQAIGWDARSGVFDAHVDPWAAAGEPCVGRRGGRGTGADDDPPRLAVAGLGELDRIAEQVDQDLPHARLVAPAGQSGRIAAHRIGEVDPARAGGWSDEGHRGADRLPDPERGPLDRHPVRLEAREVEHLGDQVQQMTRARARAGEIPPLALGERAVGLEIEQLEVAQHGVDRRADLVAHRRQEATLGVARRFRFQSSRLGRLRRRLQQRVGGAPRGEIARHLGEPQQRAVLVPEGRQRDARPEGGAVAAHALALARVLAALGRGPQVPLGGAVLGAAGGIEQPQVGTLGLVLRPPLDEPGALTPEGDHALGIHQEDGVVADVLGERRERASRHARAGLAGERRTDRPLSGGAKPFHPLAAPQRFGALLVLAAPVARISVRGTMVVSHAGLNCRLRATGHPDNCSSG
jgi:hypothetical protein